MLVKYLGRQKQFPFEKLYRNSQTSGNIKSRKKQQIMYLAGSNLPWLSNPTTENNWGVFFFHTQTDYVQVFLHEKKPELD